MANWKKILTKEPSGTDLATPASASEYLMVNGSNETEWVKPQVPIVMQWSMYHYLGANPSASAGGTARRRWYHPHTSRGPSYYYWSSYWNGVQPRSFWYDSYNPCIYIPFDCQLRHYSMAGNLVANVATGLDGGTALFELKTNRDSLPFDGTGYSIPIITVGTQQSFTLVENNYSRCEQEDFTGANSIGNATLQKGDILIPMMCRDFNLDSSTVRYFEGVFTIVLWKELETT